MINATVVVPTYNRRDLVLRAVENLVNQDYPADLLEIIVVTDRCTDGTEAALSARFGDRILVIQSRNAGQSSALNTGIDRARGEIVITLDDEMLAVPGFVAAHVREHDDNRAHHMTVTGYSPVALSREAAPLQRFVAAHYEQFHERLRDPKRVQGPLDVNPANMSFRTSEIQSVGGFDESYLFQRNDIALGIRLIENGFTLGYSEEARADQHPALDSEVIVNRAEPRAACDVRLARDHPWCIPFLPFGGRFAPGPARRRWEVIWRGRHLIAPAVRAARKAARENVALVNRDYGVRYAIAAIRAAGGWSEWQKLGTLAREAT